MLSYQVGAFFMFFTLGGAGLATLIRLCCRLVFVQVGGVVGLTLLGMLT